MSIVRYSVEHPIVTSFATFLVLLGGAAAYFSLGQLEDPEFTVKVAQVVTFYPGATAQEVEQEVTEHLEIAIQSMPQVDYIESLSRPGNSTITVHVHSKYSSRELPQIWDELRRKVGDAQRHLPPQGCGEPMVFDDFGDVYGLLMAVTSDGFSPAELEDYVDDMRRELSLVPGVARVELWGVQQRCIYIDVNESQLSQLGLNLADVQRVLAEQNAMVDSGGFDLHDERLLMLQTGAFASPEDIGNLIIRGASRGGEHTDELIRIRDFATVRRGYVEPPRQIMRFDGKPAMGLAISNVSGANVVDMGRAVDRRLNELLAKIPVGIEIHRVSWQSDQVAESIDDFMLSLAQAVTIVLVVLWLVTGLRVAAIVGLCGLAFTILATFLVMSLWGIDLQRMSLGALVIAMALMVDNAIVVADGAMVRISQGMDRKQAVIEATQQPMWPLLGATIIAVMAFFPIYVSTENAGEYCESLFQVVAISLMISWVLSITITPILCQWLIPAPKPGAANTDPYAGRVFVLFRELLVWCIARRYFVLAIFVALLVASGVGFNWVKRSFFPDAARLQFMFDYWAPEGTKIQRVAQDVRDIENHLMADAGVTAVTTFIGQGPPRFYLPVEPEMPNPAYAQLIVNVRSLADLNRLISETDLWARENVPQGECLVRRYGLGPSKTWTVEARIVGPGNADLPTLRALGAEGQALFEQTGLAKISRTNWRHPIKRLKIEYDQERARWAAISRADISAATRRGFDGLMVGQYREDNNLHPIIARAPQEERRWFVDNMRMLQVQPGQGTASVPLDQVTRSLEVDWEDSLIWRRDRKRTVTAQANPLETSSADVLRSAAVPAIEEFARRLPPGYELEWGGDFESARDAKISLLPGIVPSALIVAFLVVALFNAFRPPLIIAGVIPFAMIGVTAGLLLTRQPFGFLALLGAMSLVGMMIKNAIVLLDQVSLEKAAGKGDYAAMLDSALSRLRPVMLAGGTTVLGVIPLLQDVFWVAMAVTIMFGLAFGTVLTMIGVPVLYAIFYRLPKK